MHNNRFQHNGEWNEDEFVGEAFPYQEESIILRSVEDGKGNPDIVLVAVPPSLPPPTLGFEAAPQWIARARLGFDAPPSWGIPQLATELERHGIKVGVSWAQALHVPSPDGTEAPLHPRTLARAIIKSNCSTVGLSLINVTCIPWAQKLLEEMNAVAEQGHLEFPRILAGGPQATLDPFRTAEELHIPVENIIRGKGVRRLLEKMGVRLDPVQQEQYRANPYNFPFNPQWMGSLYHPSGMSAASISLLSVGGGGCCGGEPCHFCGAKVHGGRTEIQSGTFTSQIALLRRNSIQGAFAVDDNIDLASPSVRRETKRRLKYAYSEGVPVQFIFSRPDDVAQVSEEYLSTLYNYGLRRVFVGLESADLQTIEAMNRLKPGQSFETYLESVFVAVRKLTSVGISVNLSAIVGYPWGNPDFVQANANTLSFIASLSEFVDEDDESGQLIIMYSLWDPVPGSHDYRTLIQAGLTPQELLEYQQGNRDVLNIAYLANGERYAQLLRNEETRLFLAKLYAQRPRILWEMVRSKQVAVQR